LLGIVWNRSEKEMTADVDRVAALRDAAAFPILLAHHPHAFDRATELGIPLTLAGHTHGGQMMLNRHVGAGPSMYRYWSGLYQKTGRALVVGNGTGNWFPVRINAPAEIIHLTLRKA
jgi:predicted MPP superfamily phosphohydrolase